MDDRVVLRGIVYVLCKGVSWADVPTERIGCSGVTAWRRLRDWTEAGLWPRLHEILLGELRKKGCSTWTTQRSTARTSGQQAPPDHRPPRHPLAVTLTGGNRHDVTQLLPLLDAIPRIRGVRG
ncbi:hypothetical protein Sm713_67970 [Streptomyces sp. TS71-3]|nr:hypothetical protein Sm713_67970 [Streptomyces sp. TS71-3]